MRAVILVLVVLAMTACGAVAMTPAPVAPAAAAPAAAAAAPIAAAAPAAAVAVPSPLAAAAPAMAVIGAAKTAVSSGSAPAPCDRAGSAAGAGPAPPRQFLDQRLPLVVDDYHPPAGGFNPSHIPSKEVDVAARKILREIQKHEKEMKEHGDQAETADDNGVLDAEEHKLLKQLLWDSDILVRAAQKALADNGPVQLQAVDQVAANAVSKAAAAEKKIAASTAAAAAPAAGQVGATLPGASVKSERAAPRVKATQPGQATKSGAATARSAPPAQAQSGGPSAAAMRRP